MVLRIGINLGDVITEGDDIYGDGVNIAAPLEPLDEPGGICVSSIVNERITARLRANCAVPMPERPAASNNAAMAKTGLCRQSGDRRWERQDRQ